MITTYQFNPDGSRNVGNELHLNRWLEQGEGVIWVDLQHNFDNLKNVGQLMESLGCHPLAIKDALRKRHPPKVEVFDDHLFILYRGITEVTGTLSFKHQDIALFISENMLITVHPEPSRGIAEVLEKHLSPTLLQSPLKLALKIMHSSSGLYLDQLFAFEDELSVLEDELYSRHGEDALATLSTHKANLIRLKRIFDYHYSLSCQMRELSSPLLKDAEHDHDLIDLDDRFERLLSLAQMHYDICGDMIDSYISITSHQLNMTMRVLTVITAVFVPLSFLAGIYGMNFDHIPELHHRYGYFILLTLMLSIAGTLTWWFKRKQWF